MKFFYFLLAVILFWQVRASADEPAHFVGSLLSTKDEVWSATDVVIGKFTKVKEGDAISMMGTLYHGEITVLQDLKGTAFGTVEVGFSVLGRREEEPNLQDSYIMILVQQHNVRKILPVTEANIASIKALIASAPKAK